MIAFFQDVVEFPFLRNALLASLLTAIAAGMSGTLVVVRRSTYLAGAVSHSILAGLGLARLLQRRFDIQWLSPMGGALLVAIGVALLLARSATRGRHRPDTLLSAIWTGGMALGVTFVALTPGFQEDLMSYLLGSLLLVSNSDLLWMTGLNLIIITTMLLCYNRFLAIAFNEELTRLRGVNTAIYETIFHLLTALTIVLLVRVVGIVLAIALLTLPAATASLITRRLDHMMLASVAIAALISISGLAISYTPDLPPGATIVELAVLLYLVASLFNHQRKKA